MSDRRKLALVTVEEHALIVVVVVLVGDLFLPVGVALPQLLVHHLLDLWGPETLCSGQRLRDGGALLLTFVVCFGFKIKSRLSL